MGGDGGVIASNRRYMRGAGHANHTADAAGGKGNNNDPALAGLEAARAMVTCAISGQPLQFTQTQTNNTIVACRYGRLYNKEAAVEALLRRKTHPNEADQLGSHIRGLKDLYPVRFYLTEKEKEGRKQIVPACPITGKELNGQIPAHVILPGQEGEVNVVSERALTMKSGGGDGELLLADYGPIEETIRLAPPKAELEQIKLALEASSHQRSSKKKKKSSKKKRKKHPDEDDDDHDHDEEGTKHKAPKKKDDRVANAARARVSAAVQKNEVLSSLFKTTTAADNLSEKEKKDNLFARS